jgi:dCTP deaminase
MIPPGRSGVLPNHYLLRAIEAGVIDVGPSGVETANVQPASLDLRLGDVAYRMRCSFLPGNADVETRIRELAIDTLDMTGDGAVLETNRPYLIPLQERLQLPHGIRGKANPKSSTGRVDVFTRVITDRSYRFDEIADGYCGKLYLEVVPLSFAVRVRRGLTLNQLRLAAGRRELSELSDNEIAELHGSQPLLYVEGRPVSPSALTLSGGLFLSLDLRGDSAGRIGYRARESAPLLDLTVAKPVEPDPFWETVRREPDPAARLEAAQHPTCAPPGRVVLTEKKFYLLMSEEAVVVAPGLASEMTAYDPTSGELRTHYAGFFDPGFGYDPAGEFLGAKAALEVRAHDVPFMIEHGQQVCKLTFERMLEEPTILYGREPKSNYQRQTDALGKYFLKAGAPQHGGCPENDPDAR